MRRIEWKRIRKVKDDNSAQRRKTSHANHLKIEKAFSMGTTDFVRAPIILRSEAILQSHIKSSPMRMSWQMRNRELQKMYAEKMLRRMSVSFCCYHLLNKRNTRKHLISRRTSAPGRSGNPCCRCGHLWADIQILRKWGGRCAHNVDLKNSHYLHCQFAERVGPGENKGEHTICYLLSQKFKFKEE